jgi:hypothetical protein
MKETSDRNVEFTPIKWGEAILHPIFLPSTHFYCRVISHLGLPSP